MPLKVKLIFNSTADMGLDWQIANDLFPITANYGYADWSGTVYPEHAPKQACWVEEKGDDMFILMEIFSGFNTEIYNYP